MIQKSARPLYCIPKNRSILAVGSSTGGTNALAKVIPVFSKDFPMPIVIVQHMPKQFTAKFAHSLDRISALKVVEADDGEELLPGKVIIAPGGKHMVARKANHGMVVRLTDDPPVNSCRPSVDILFKSLSDCYQDKGVLAMILTGMGSDGKEGVSYLKRFDCFCITQSSRTCVIDSMPVAVEKAGLSDLSLDIDDIGSHIMEWVHFNNMISNTV